MSLLTRPTTQRQAVAIVAIVVAAVTILVVLIDQIILPSVAASADIIVVPNVVGESEPSARRRLTALGLDVQESREQYSVKAQKGQVLSQQPYAGARVKEGRRIYLTISRGEETVRMPDVRGRSLRDARLDLMRLGLAVGDIAFEYNDSIPSQRVITQGIVPGTAVAAGTTTSLIVCLGSSGVKMPDLVGMTMDDALQTIDQSGLVRGAVTSRSSATFDAGTVLEQSPSADSTVKPGTVVNIIVVR